MHIPSPFFLNPFFSFCWISFMDILVCGGKKWEFAKQFVKHMHKLIILISCRIHFFIFTWFSSFRGNVYDVTPVARLKQRFFSIKIYLQSQGHHYLSNIYQYLIKTWLLTKTKVFYVFARRRGKSCNVADGCRCKGSWIKVPIYLRGKNTPK